MSLSRQQGFTIFELMVAMAIGGLIMPVMVGSIIQINRGTSQVNDNAVVQQDIDNASSWFTRDLSLAKTTDVLDGASAVSSMRVSWVDETGWAVEGGEAHCAKYSIQTGTTRLERNYDGGNNCANPGTITIIARNVESILFSRSGNFITVAITSTLQDETENISYFVNTRIDASLTSP